MQTDLSDSSLFNHKSVMTDEILVSVDQYPLISDKKLTAIDATLGGGGHSYQYLSWRSQSFISIYISERTGHLFQYLII